MELGDKDLTVALFDQFPIRRTWHEAEWWYSVVDCMAALAATPNPRGYWSDLKRKLKKEGAMYEDFVHSLPLPAADGRMAKTDCATTEGLLRIIQAVPSPNAEPFKQWLAQVGAAALEDTEDGNKQLRSEHRLKLHTVDALLHELVSFRGIVTPEQHQALTDANYAGLYAVATERNVIEMRHLPMLSDEPMDWMGVAESAYNEFQRALTATVVERKNLQGQTAITTAAEDVGVQIRLTIERTGGTMPEDLPRYRRLSRGDWVPELQDDAPAELPAETPPEA
ncbi:MAG: hypothetical protein H0X24_24545 [Ktedonobacterales bacterium]|nr:hypothetical protein [Ktedonobacterales bacterium]